MGLVANFTMADMNAVFAKSLKKIEQSIIDRYILTGQVFVQNARNNGTYMNHTFNLISSIACIVLKNGKVVFEDYQLQGDGIEGMASAISLLDLLSESHPIGFALIVVAGADYAAAVESRGKDVLTSSSITAKNDLLAAFKR